MRDLHGLKDRRLIHLIENGVRDLRVFFGFELFVLGFVGGRGVFFLFFGGDLCLNLCFL